MTIRLKHDHGKLDAIELTYLDHHLALPHLNRYLMSKGSRRCKAIKKIVIDHSNLNNKDYIALHDILKLSSKIKEISFKSNHIDTNDVAYLFDSLGGKELKTVKLVDNWIGDKISANFFSFLKNKKIAVLDLSLNWLRDIGVMHLLDTLDARTELTELRLSCNDFGLSAMKALRHFVSRHPSLTALDISYNQLNGACVEEISTMISESHSLTYLNIRSNKIGDEGANYIAQALKSNNNLRHIDLSDNEILESGLSRLLQVAETHDKLENLILKYNHFIPTVLKANRPDLQVVY